MISVTLRFPRFFVSILLPLSALALSGGCAVPVLIFAGAGATGVAIAQQRSTEEAVQDLATETRIQDSLFREEFQNLFRNVNTIVVEGRVLLTGTVPSEREINKAVEIVEKTEGVTEILNELSVGEIPGPAIIASDTRISLEIRGKQVAASNIRQRNYWVTTEDGVVHMIGIALDNAELSAAIDVARNVRGVRKVVNHVILRDDPRRIQQKQPTS